MRFFCYVIGISGERLEIKIQVFGSIRGSKGQIKWGRNLDRQMVKQEGYILALALMNLIKCPAKY